jgi:glucose-6-phosphate 1-dehydrogenase
MSPDSHPEAAIFIVFGFAGDLTWRSRFLPSITCFSKTAGAKSKPVMGSNNQTLRRKGLGSG